MAHIQPSVTAVVYSVLQACQTTLSIYTFTIALVRRGERYSSIWTMTVGILAHVHLWTESAFIKQICLLQIVLTGARKPVHAICCTGQLPIVFLLFSALLIYSCFPAFLSQTWLLYLILFPIIVLLLSLTFLYFSSISFFIFIFLKFSFLPSFPLRSSRSQSSSILPWDLHCFLPVRLLLEPQCSDSAFIFSSAPKQPPTAGAA